MRFCKRSEWLEAAVNDELLMMHADNGRFVSLNETGTFLWAQMDQPRDNAALADSLQCEFEVDREQAVADVAAWLTTMQEHDVIEPASD